MSVDAIQISRACIPSEPKNAVQHNVSAGVALLRMDDRVRWAFLTVWLCSIGGRDGHTRNRTRGIQRLKPRGYMAKRDDSVFVRLTSALTVNFGRFVLLQERRSSCIA